MSKAQMTGGRNIGESVMAQIAVLACVVLAILGFIWYGASSEVWHRQWQDLTGRPGGSMSFRFILQPIMASIAAIHDGISDARLGRSPFLWTVLTKPEKRAGRLQEGLVSTARIILLGLGMDTIYQLKELGRFYPGEAVIIALALAFVPYLLLRGPINRIASHWLRKPPTPEAM
jgi:hypothetical protein